jgi:HAMP domain-containing protein
MIGRRREENVALSYLISPVAKGMLALSFCILGTQSVSAHVKWFCAYDVAGQPRGLENVLCQDFELLVGAAFFWFFAGCLIEGTSLGEAMIRSMDRVTNGLRLHTEQMIRAACAFFFISLWAIGGVLLTPELKTTSAFVGPLQLAIAAGMLSRRTMPLAVASKAARSIARGDLETNIPKGGSDELGTLLTAMGVMRDNIRAMVDREVSQRRSAQARLLVAMMVRFSSDQRLMLKSCWEAVA